jgi:hypothetical protein
VYKLPLALAHHDESTPILFYSVYCLLRRRSEWLETICA